VAAAKYSNEGKAKGEQAQKKKKTDRCLGSILFFSIRLG